MKKEKIILRKGDKVYYTSNSVGAICQVIGNIWDNPELTGE